MNLNKISEEKFFLGESALWDECRKYYYFVNIFDGELCQYDPGTQVLVKHSLACMVSACVLSEKNELILVTQKGIGIYDINSEKFICKVHPNQAYEKITRYNDCKCDPAGRLYVGTMDLKGRPGFGKLFCVSPGWEWSLVMEHVDYSNGIVWTENKMIYTDTFQGKVFIFDYELETGRFENRRVLCEFPKGWPDGMALDDENHLWVALWGGHGIACVDIDTGKTIRKISMDVPNVSSLCFGKNHGREVLITTAQKDLNKKELEKYPQAGAVYLGEIGVSGPEFYKYKEQEESIR